MDHKVNFRWDEIKTIEISRTNYTSGLEGITRFNIKLFTENRSNIKLEYISREKMESLISLLQEELDRKY